MNAPRLFQRHGTCSVDTDYLYRDAQLLAAETRQGRRHYHLDHLGTPRLITNGVGYPVAYHVYYPFGEEATAFNQDRERMKFTGHERDLGSLVGAGDDLDYMHQRFCSPLTGRFLSTDIAQGKPGMPQSWNRYSYAFDNPIKYIDPNGQDGLIFSDYGGAALAAIGRTTDQIAFAMALPYFHFRAGVMNDDPKQLAIAGGLIALDALGSYAVEAFIAGRALSTAGRAGTSGAIAGVEGLTAYTTKAAAREGAASLGLGEVQAAAVNRTISRATSTSRIDIAMTNEGNVVVQTTRAGKDGYQVVQVIVDQAGEKQVVQLAYNSAGKLVHVDPKK